MADEQSPNVAEFFEIHFSIDSADANLITNQLDASSWVSARLEPDDRDVASIFDALHQSLFNIGIPHQHRNNASSCDVSLMEESLIYETCKLCCKKVSNPKVVFYCDCNYHLECYLYLYYNSLFQPGDITQSKCLACEDKIFKKETSEFETCSICLEPMKADLRKLPCGHRFHKTCIRQWEFSVQQGNCKTCPNCRKPL